MTTPNPRTLLTGTTPGPWEAEPWSDAAPDADVIAPHSDEDGTRKGWTHIATDASTANARLMAAAPDLAARVIALEDGIRALVGRFEDAQRYRIQLDDRTTLNSLRALLDGDTTTPVGDTNTTPKETK